MLAPKLLLLLLLLERSRGSSSTPRKAPVLRLKEGKISGKVLASDRGREYFAYTGIPYAQPPTGDRRFRFPKRLPSDAWTGVKRCEDIPPKCPQLSFPERRYEGDENCLYLNVYTHKLEDTEQPVEELNKVLRPVLFWIHGGGFQHGSGDFDAVGPERFMDNTEDVVLVTANYRLNALAFTVSRALFRIACLLRKNTRIPVYFYWYIIEDVVLVTANYRLNALGTVSKLIRTSPGAWYQYIKEPKYFSVAEHCDEKCYHYHTPDDLISKITLSDARTLCKCHCILNVMDTCKYLNRHM